MPQHLSTPNTSSEIDAAVRDAKAHERARIAREVHDELGGDLIAIKMALAMLVKRLPAAAVEDDDLRKQAGYVDTLVDRAIDTMHHLVDGLPGNLLKNGLAVAMAVQVEEFSCQSGLICTCDVADDMALISSVPLEQSTALLRIARESLSNVGKHAQAGRVQVRLRVQGHALHLQIEDDGKGIEAGAHVGPDSFGIRGMMERARALGGELCVLAAAPRGCIIDAVIPWHPGKAGKKTLHNSSLKI